MKDQFRRILDLVRRTGDTMVVTDPEGEEMFVVMDLKRYEELLEVSEVSEDAEADIWQTMKPAGADGETWDLDKMDEGELANLEEQYRQFAQRNVKEAIDTKEIAKEAPVEQSKKSDSEDFGEEEFYLEPVE